MKPAHLRPRTRSPVRLPRRPNRLPIALLALVLAAGARFAAAADPHWLLIDTTKQTLTVMNGTAPDRHFDNIAIGRNGTNPRHLQGDDTTPVGRYRVTDIRSSDQYHRFIALDYPNLQDAAEALEAGVIAESDYQRILKAHESGRQPPADTALGGHIGIHGLGQGDPRVHAEFNWTNGCVAMTNEEVDDLIARIDTGVTVIIR